MKQYILIAILILAAVLRFWNLSSVPPSTSMDEASISYNAYSVVKTGGDEYGQLPSISHRSYDDWRRATYLYLTTPFVAIFGLQAISVRLPAVILSILTVWATYHIILSLFSKRTEQSVAVALMGTLLLAISPWHIYISRLGHESNACLAFFIFGVFFFLQGEKNKSWIKIFIAMIFFTLSMVSYYSGQAFIPLLVLGLLVIFRKSLLAMVKQDKRILIPFFVLSIALIPIFALIFSPSSLVRFQATSTFKQQAHQEMFQKRVELRNKAVENNDIIGAIVYNRHLFPLQVLVQGYISHFNPQWLFTNPSSQPHKVPNMGLLYLWEIPFIIIGIIAFLASRLVDPRARIFVFFWFLLGSLPAAIATQAPHAMRSYNILPTWQIFTAFGLTYIFYRAQKIRVLVLLAFAFLIIISLAAFYQNYFIVFPKEQSKSFHYGLSQAIPYVLSVQDNYSKIVFSNTDNLYQSYMVFLYHSKYDPSRYQKFGGTKSGGFAETHVFDKYEFRPVNLQKEKIEKGVLYVVNPEEISDIVGGVKTFRNLDGTEAIKVFSK